MAFILLKTVVNANEQHFLLCACLRIESIYGNGAKMSTARFPFIPSVVELSERITLFIYCEERFIFFSAAHIHTKTHAHTTENHITFGMLSHTRIKAQPMIRNINSQYRSM